MDNLNDDVELEKIVNSKPQASPRNDYSERIRHMILSDNSLTQEGIVKKLSEEGITLSRLRVAQLLKKMNFTRKRLKRVASRVLLLSLIEERRQYSLRIYSILNSNLLFLDEPRFNLYTTNNYGYSPKKIDAVRHVQATLRRNVSLLSIINNEKIENFKLIDGPYTGDNFLNF